MTAMKKCEMKYFQSCLTFPHSHGTILSTRNKLLSRVTRNETQTMEEHRGINSVPEIHSTACISMYVYTYYVYTCSMPTAHKITPFTICRYGPVPVDIGLVAKELIEALARVNIPPPNHTRRRKNKNLPLTKHQSWSTTQQTIHIVHCLMMIKPIASHQHTHRISHICYNRIQLM